MPFLSGTSKETSWEVTNQQGEIQLTGSGYEDRESYLIQQCLPAGGCYTLTLYDTYGDGMTVGNDGAYELIVNGETVAESDFPGFGSQTSFDFGTSCENSGGGNSDPEPLDCDPSEIAFEFTLTTDIYG